MGGGESSSSSANTSTQTTQSYTDAFNQSSNFTQNYSNVGNTSTSTHFGPESTVNGISPTPILLAVAGAVALMFLVASKR